MLVEEAYQDHLDKLKETSSQNHLWRQDVLQMFEVLLKCLLKEFIGQWIVFYDHLDWHCVTRALKLTFGLESEDRLQIEQGVSCNLLFEKNGDS